MLGANFSHPLVGTNRWDISSRGDRGNTARDDVELVRGTTPRLELEGSDTMAATTLILIFEEDLVMYGSRVFIWGRYKRRRGKGHAITKIHDSACQRGLGMKVKREASGHGL